MIARFSIVIVFAGLLMAEQIDELETLYYEGRYEEVIANASRQISENPGLMEEDQIKLRKYVAFCHVALEEKAQAQQEFLKILAIDSSFTLNPQLVSPKIIEIFEEACEEFHKPDTSVRINVSPAYEPSFDLRKAAVKSIVFPGLGQVYSGQKVKGWSLVAAEGLSICGLIVSQVFLYKTRRDYLAAGDSTEIIEKYGIYNNWYKARNVFSGFTVGIWISAPLEMVLFPPGRTKNR